MTHNFSYTISGQNLTKKHRNWNKYIRITKLTFNIFHTLNFFDESNHVFISSFKKICLNRLWATKETSCRNYIQRNYYIRFKPVLRTHFYWTILCNIWYFEFTFSAHKSNWKAIWTIQFNRVAVNISINHHKIHWKLRSSTQSVRSQIKFFNHKIFIFNVKDFQKFHTQILKRSI